MINNEIVILLILLVVVYFICINRETFTNIIVRPLDFTSYEQTGCKDPLLNDKPGLKFCNDSIPRFYDVRKINSPTYTSYYDMLKDLVTGLGDRTEFKNNQLQEIYDCDVSDYQVKNLLNTKLAEIIINNPRFHNNGSFKLENITVIDVDLKYYKDIEDNKYIKALFNLYDTTRAASTQAYALISNEDSLVVENAGLVYPNLTEDTSSVAPAKPLRFDIYDSLLTRDLSSYVSVEPGTTVAGGISSEMEKLIDVYYQYN